MMNGKFKDLVIKYGNAVCILIVLVLVVVAGLYLLGKVMVAPVLLPSMGAADGEAEPALAWSDSLPAGAHPLAPRAPASPPSYQADKTIVPGGVWSSSPPRDHPLAPHNLSGR